MKLKHIIEAIHEMDSSELIDLNNIYCQENNIEGEVWHNDEEFFEVFFSNTKPLDLLRSAHCGEYTPNDNYVKFNGYGNLESFDYFEVKDLEDFPEVIAEHIKENPRDYEHLFNF
jgi:hypothetical protein